MNLLYILLHESSNTGLGLMESIKFLKIAKFCEKQSLNAKMSDLKQFGEYCEIYHDHVQI